MHSKLLLDYDHQVEHQESENETIETPQSQGASSN